MTSPLWSLLAAALCAAALMPLIMRLRVLDKDPFSGPQNVHNEPTSRLGGAAVFAACALGIVVAFQSGHSAGKWLLLLLASALPVLLAGLFEDVTRRVEPRQRLLAALLSAIMASWLAGGSIARLDIPHVDDALKIAVLALPLTWFMVVGACNAINLIDGAHGLAGGTALILFGGMAVAAQQVGDTVILVASMAMIGALAGFLAWNYPRGKVFLGDGGAYFVGFMYAQLSIQIVARNSELSAWFVIMLAGYPIMETLYSMYRRKLVHRTPSMQPDAMHLHSLVFRHLLRQRQVAFRADGSPLHSQDRMNARVAPRLWLHGALCCGLALAFQSNTPALIAGCIVYIVFYCWQYASMSRRRGTDSKLLAAALREQRDGN
ncbi:MAG: glycosyltransferase [Lautropia sp.]